MILEDMLSLIGRSSSPVTDYTPIACLLNSGYGCVGDFNSFVNQSLCCTIVLLQMRLTDFRVEDGHSRHGRVADFDDFLRDAVAQHVPAAEDGAEFEPTDMHLADLRVEEGRTRHGRAADFDDFLQDVVAQHVPADEDGEEFEPIDMRLVELRVEEGHSRRGRVSDFDDFLQDVVAQHVEADEDCKEFEVMDAQCR